MPAIKKSSRKALSKSPGRSTLTLTAETYGKIDRLRGEASRSAWIQRLIEREEQQRERERLAQRLSQEYTAAVTRETLALNQQFPIHEK